MKNIYCLIAICAWLMSSIWNIPVFAVLNFAFIGAFVWIASDHTDCNARELKNPLLIAYAVSSLVLGYCLAIEIYPSNISLLVALGIGCAAGSGWVMILFSRCKAGYLSVYVQDKTAVLVYSILFAALLIFGSYVSVRIGLTWDEAMERDTFERSLTAISEGLRGGQAYYQFNQWVDKYYGIGFYFPAYFFHKVFAGVLSRQFEMDIASASLLSRHLAVFWFFAFSSILVLKIVRLLTQNLRFAMLVSITYLIYPYLLGHGLMNVKDSPFSVVWLICAYFLLVIIYTYISKKIIKRDTVIALVLSVAWLISIRLSGVLFFVPITLTILFLMTRHMYSYCLLGANAKHAINVSCAQWRILTRNHVYMVLYCIFLLATFIGIAYPVMWQSPYEFIKGLQFMGAHPWTGCTLTLGECMPSQRLPYTYIPAWLMVKLPLFALLGLLVLPWMIFSRFHKKQGISVMPLMILALSIVAIYALLIIKGSTLFDEIRHVLFIAPILFIVGAVALYLLSKKLATAIIVATLALFVVDNVKMYPYQYVWFNEVARFSNINQNFETDWWGSSLRRLARKVNQNATDFSKTQCIYADPAHLMGPFLNKNDFPCINNASALAAHSPTPYLYAAYVRGTGLSLPRGCKLIYVEKFSLAFAPKPIEVGKLGYCEKVER